MWYWQWMVIYVLMLLWLCALTVGWGYLYRLMLDQGATITGMVEALEEQSKEAGVLERNVTYKLDLARATNESGLNPCRPGDNYHVEPHTYDYCPS